MSVYTYTNIKNLELKADDAGYKPPFPKVQMSKPCTDITYNYITHIVYKYISN